MEVENTEFSGVGMNRNDLSIRMREYCLGDKGALTKEEVSDIEKIITKACVDGYNLIEFLNKF